MGMTTRVGLKMGKSWLEKSRRIFGLGLLLIVGFSPSWAGPDVGGNNNSGSGSDNHLIGRQYNSNNVHLHNVHTNRLDNHHHSASVSSHGHAHGHGHGHGQSSLNNIITKGNSGLNHGGIVQLNLTFINHMDQLCPQFCTEQSQYNYNYICVHRGCIKWKNGLQNGCSYACGGIESNFRESYACQMGCRKAIEEYYNRITEMLGVLHPPTLSSDSLKSTSLQLSWEGSWPKLPYLVFTIERRLFYRDRQTTTIWETIPIVPPFNQTFFTVQNLKPYTEYQFRIGWILAHDFPPYYTAESNAIGTLPKGLPNPPEITSIQPISNTSVSVTWIPPSQPNGRLVAYILKLHKLPHGHAIIKEIPMLHNPRGYTFSGLQPNTNYSLSISAQNLEGEGDAANIHFVTPQTTSTLTQDMTKRPEPRLLLQGAKDVYIQQVDLLLEPDVTVYALGSSNGDGNVNVTAITSHFKNKWVFVATSDGQVVRTTLDGNHSLNIFTNGQLDIHPVTFMSVDWLHDKLYLVGRERGRSGSWCVKRAGLNGEDPITIYRGLVSQPIDFMADPFTGYLYWVSKPSGGRNFAALYRMDMLSDNVTPTAVIETERGDELGPFTVDFVNYRILIVHKRKNTILSVSLDGDVVDIRRNTMSPQFVDAVSIGMYNGLFYWTTGQSVVVEEYNEEQNSFYQNSYDVPKSHQPCSRLIILHPDLQPVPVPMAPPRLPQVVMGTRQARVSWRPPAVIAGLGRGAWTNWTYELHLSDNTTYSNISKVEFVLKDLYPSASYTVQVLAYSSAGKGPLSIPFRGKTLRETAFNISLLWASSLGLFQTDALGENVLPLVDSSSWSGSGSRGNVQNYNYIWSLTWHDDKGVLFALNNGSVFHHESAENLSQFGPNEEQVTSRRLKFEPIQLKGISYAQSIAFEYIGQKIYWSDPKRQTILRCSLRQCQEPGDVEWLRVVTMAKEINVDSWRALLIWSTGHSLEVSRLNGYTHSVLYQEGLFSGVQIQGFTLDMTLAKVYWVNRVSSRSTLHWVYYDVSGSRGNNQEPKLLASFDEISIIGPIRYFNERLLWLQGSNQTVLADVNAVSQTSSFITVNTISNITCLHVRDESSQRYPVGLERSKIQVVPNSVNRWSIKIEGKSDNFSISWQPVNNTNYGGNVYYEVGVNNTFSRVTIHNSIRIDSSNFNSRSRTSLFFPPFTDIDITITALSHWASAKPTTVRKQTPSSKPSEPTNPRVFVQKVSAIYRKVNEVPLSHEQQQDGGVRDGLLDLVNVELRWDPPEKPNGQILGYLIQCWRDGVKKSDCSCSQEGQFQFQLQKSRCQIKNLSQNSTYKFSVQAYTNAGAGNVSRMVQVDPKLENPVPELLIVTKDQLEIFDVDQSPIRRVEGLGGLVPISAVYFALEDSIYWINEGQDLMTVNLVSGNKTRILSLSGQGEASHLALDWIGQRLFWAMEFPEVSLADGDRRKDHRFAIMSLDLATISQSKLNRTPSVIITSDTPIKGITINPFQNSIFWTTSKVNGINNLYSSRMDGSSPTQFLSRDRINCNCSNCSSVGEAISFDATGFHGMTHGILFTNDQSIWLADERGCDCLQMVNMTLHSPSRPRLAPYKLAGSAQHLFWAAEYLHASEKPGNGVTELLTFGVREIFMMGPSAQPFPDWNCLVPDRLEPLQPVQFNQFSSYSLHLHLPLGKLKGCTLGDDISMASLKYKVYYGSVDEKGLLECTPSSLTSCRAVQTTHPILNLTNLFPFTTYTVFVSVTNIYAQLLGQEPLTSPAIMFSTAAGAPMPPKLLRLEPLTPATIRVVWRQPDKLNGERVWYKVYWQPLKKRISPGPGWAEVEASSDEKWSELELQSKKNRTEFHLVVKGLHPACNYTVWVVAFSEKGDAFSSSENLTVTTYPSPSNITLQSVTPHSLNLQWVAPAEPIILHHQISYRMGWSTQGWNQTARVNSTMPNQGYNYNIQGLRPNTMYGFKILAWYSGDPDSPYEWPPQNTSGVGQFNLETLADKPGAPGQPIARGIGKTLYEISWDRAEENGANVQIYSLECHTDSNSPVFETVHQQHEVDGLGQVGQGSGHGTVEESLGRGETTVSSVSRKKREWTEHIKPEIPERLVATEKGQAGWGGSIFHWTVVYNGTEPRWEVQNLDMETMYYFRVRALNSYGWGQYSQESAVVSLISLTVVAEPESAWVIVGTITLSILALTFIGSIFIYIYRQKSKEKPSLHGQNSSVELATLRELPGGSSFIHQSNILYAPNDLVIDIELSGVLQVTRHQISLTKFLGSGAFGEVYEGIALDLPRTDGEDSNRVAIKTLRKGASNGEKMEFIQEAKLMTQFRHPHILQLLGICIDTDPCCLLLELMDGGDLLSYLRSNRPHLGSSVVLSVVDLLKMCVDVAKGCVYLEEMHFVHRDLAARNCLVRLIYADESESESRHPQQQQQQLTRVGGRRRVQNRVVKIGDFGLARDVYRNDYYRKEGEGLLPVRWMPPESLIDGVYTTHSDVWAFGVTMWEIMTLGQQPYPARNNLEVLHYVRSGGRLQQPPHCPERLSELMIQSWEFNEDNRPSFKSCLTQLELILRDFESHVTEDNSNYPTISPSDSQLQQYNNHLQAGTGTKLSNSYFDENGQISEQGQDQTVYTSNFHPSLNSNHPTNFHNGPLTNVENVLYTESHSYPKYLQVICGTQDDDNNYPIHSLPTLHPQDHFHLAHTPFTSLPFGSTEEGYEIPLPRKPPRNPKNAQIVTRLASKVLARNSLDDSGISGILQLSNGEIGLPSPSYWNCNGSDGMGISTTTPTSSTSATGTNFPFSGSSISESDSLNDPPMGLRSKCYVNARRLGMFDEGSQGRSSHFRNLLASTTSTEDDLEGEAEIDLVNNDVEDECYAPHSHCTVPPSLHLSFMA